MNFFQRGINDAASSIVSKFKNRLGPLGLIRICRDEESISGSARARRSSSPSLRANYSSQHTFNLNKGRIWNPHSEIFRSKTLKWVFRSYLLKIWGPINANNFSEIILRRCYPPNRWLKKKKSMQQNQRCEKFSKWQKWCLRRKMYPKISTQTCAKYRIYPQMLNIFSNLATFLAPVPANFGRYTCMDSKQFPL